MRRSNKLLALLLAILMLVTALPMSIFAAESESTAELAENDGETNSAPYVGNYYHYYNFDNESVGKAIGNFNDISDPAANPYGFKVQGTLNATVAEHEDGSGNYLAVRYKASSGWRGVQIGVVDEKTLTDYSMANGLEISFKIRWVGTGALVNGNKMNFVNIRRAMQSSYTNFNLLTATYEASTTDLVISTTKGVEVARLKKGAKEFTEIKVDWHEATCTYSVFIDGVAKAEGVGKLTDLRTDAYVSTTYDDDLMATRKAFQTAYDRITLQIGRMDTTSSTSAQFHYDLDDVLIREGTLYQNTFETIGANETKSTNADTGVTTITSPSNTIKSDGAYQWDVFRANNSSGSAGVSVATETVNGVQNKYLSFAAGARLDLMDYGYQFLQDGNWTVDFKIRATADKKSDFIRLFDRVGTSTMLYVDASGKIYIGNHLFPGVTMAKADTNDWTRVTLSVLVDDNNYGVYDDYATCTRYSRCYRVAVWIDGIYAGSAFYNRYESGDSSGDTKGKILTDYTTTTKTEVTEADFLALTGLTLVDNSNGIETYKDADGALYQVKRNEDDSFASCIKIVFSGVTHADVLGFFTKGTIYGALDDLSIYRGVGPREYADTVTATEGIVSELDFGRMSTTATHISAENVNNNVLGNFFVRGERTKSGQDYTRIAETATERAYVTVNNTGSGGSSLYLNAGKTAGKIFSVNLTLRNVKVSAADMRFLNLTRQNEVGSDKLVTSGNNIYIEKDTSYLYFLADGVKYYLCAVGGQRYDFGESEWKKLTVVYDETGDKTLVSFLVNDELAYYCKADAKGIGISAAAVSISGIVTDEFFKMGNAVEQKVELYYSSDKAFSFDTLCASVKYDQVPEAPVYKDTATVDFSKYENIDEFKAEYGHQFIIIDAENAEIKIENGVLTVPDGATFGWIDYNGTFVDFLKTNAPDPTYNYRFNDGYSIEAKIKAASTGSTQTGLLKINYDDVVDKNFVYMQHGKLYMSGGLSGYTINDLESGKFTELSVLFTYNDSKSTIFADGKMVGVVGFASGFPFDSVIDDRVVFTFADNIEISELYIHKDQKRILAEKSGNVFELDPDAFLPKDMASNNYYPINLYDKNNPETTGSSGVWDSSNNAVKSYAKLLNDAEKGNYWSFNFLASQEEVTAAGYGCVVTSQTWNDIVVTDYLEDKTTVIEYDIKFAPHSGARTDVSINLCGIRRTEEGSTSNTTENLLAIKEDGTVTVRGGFALCDANGNVLKLDGTKWVNVAVIYDSNTGKLSYVVDGKIYHYKRADGTVIGLAHNIQLGDVRNYRMDAADTKIRFLDTSRTQGALGKLDISGIKVYTINDTANVDFVGVQTDTSNNNIRLVAGADMLYYGRVGFDVEAFDENGNSIADTVKSYYTSTVYSSVDENVNGTSRKVYPEEYGYRYFYTANVMGVDQKNAVKLNVTPFSVVNGVKYPASTVTLDIDLRGSMDEWKVSADNSLEIKPEGDNISANFSTTDVVSYTNNGSLELNGLGAKFAFAADLKGGVVSVNLSNAKGEDSTSSLFDIYVDGKITQKDLRLDFGHHTIVLAEGLKDKHEFMIVKKSGGDYVCINNMSIYGKLIEAPELAVEDAVIVKVSNSASKHPEYRTVHVYTKTTDSSGKYYIRYQFTPLNDPLNDYNYITGPTNSHHNAVMYRIDGTDIVDVSGGSDVWVYQILQGGEISLAIKEGGHVVTKEEFQAAKADAEKYLETVTDSNYRNRLNSAIAAAADDAPATASRAAGDFVGGWHGDENIENGQLVMYLDGEAIDFTKAGTYTGTQFIFDQTCLIDRCDEPGNNVMRHRQYMLIDSNGLRNDQTVEFLTNDFVPDTTQTYLQMCTFNRQNFSLDASERVKPENYICSNLNMLDANGKVLSNHDLSNHQVADGSQNVGSSVENRYVEYLGNPNNAGKGLYGRVGFVIDDHSFQPSSIKISVRETQGDNKWYASFKSYNGTTVPKGEIWNISDYYYFDYAPTDYVATTAE